MKLRNSKKKTKSPFFITTPDMIKKKGSIDGFFIACLKKILMINY